MITKGLGYFEIGIFQPKHWENVGTLWRTAWQMGAAGIFTIGGKPRRQTTDVLRVDKRIPLRCYEDFDVFKVFPLDVGLLGAMTDVPASQMLVGNNVFKEFKGAFTECYVNEQLARVQIPVFYYSSNESEVEIDFAVQTESRVIPIEVKAEENVKSKSLKTYIDKYPELKGLRISMLNYVDQGWMENLPLYAIEGYFSQ